MHRGSGGPGRRVEPPGIRRGLPDGRTAVVGGPGPPALAYVTGPRSRRPRVGGDVRGAGARRLGSGSQPLIAPDGRHRRGIALGRRARLGNRAGARALLRPPAAAPRTYLSRAAGTASPLAWSPDSRYLASPCSRTTCTTRRAPRSCVVIDTATGTRSRPSRTGRRRARASPSTAATGSCTGSPASEALAAPGESVRRAPPAAPATTRITRDGRSLDPLWGTARDRVRPRAHSQARARIPDLAAPGARLLRRSASPTSTCPRCSWDSCPWRSPPTDRDCWQSSRDRTRAKRGPCAAIGPRRARPLRVAGRQLIGRGDLARRIHRARGRGRARTSRPPPRAWRRSRSAEARRTCSSRTAPRRAGAV